VTQREREEELLWSPSHFVAALHRVAAGVSIAAYGEVEDPLRVVEGESYNGEASLVEWSKGILKGGVRNFRNGSEGSPEGSDLRDVVVSAAAVAGCVGLREEGRLTALLLLAGLGGWREAPAWLLCKSAAEAARVLEVTMRQHPRAAPPPREEGVLSPETPVGMEALSSLRRHIFKAEPWWHPAVPATVQSLKEAATALCHTTRSPPGPSSHAMSLIGTGKAPSLLRSTASATVAVPQRAASGGGFWENLAEARGLAEASLSLQARLTQPEQLISRLRCLETLSTLALSPTGANALSRLPPDTVLVLLECCESEQAAVREAARATLSPSKWSGAWMRQALTLQAGSVGAPSFPALDALERAVEAWKEPAMGRLACELLRCVGTTMRRGLKEDLEKPRLTLPFLRHLFARDNRLCRCLIALVEKDPVSLAILSQALAALWEARRLAQLPGLAMASPWAALLAPIMAQLGEDLRDRGLPYAPLLGDARGVSRERLHHLPTHSDPPSRGGK